MIQAIKEKVIVRGGSIEIHRSDLPEGAEAEVIIMIQKADETAPPLASYIGKGKGCFSSAKEIDDFLHSERESWQ